METFLQAVRVRTADAFSSSVGTPAAKEATWAARAVALAMGAHFRLGAHAVEPLQEVAASRDLLLAILKNLRLVVPDDVSSLAAALRRAAPWQTVLLRAGDHLVDAREAGDPGSSVLYIKSPVHICGEGEEVTVLRGTIVAEPGCAGGSISNLRLDDAGDCCLRCESGVWELRHVRLRCAHGAALKMSKHARAKLHGCVMGGEGEEEMGRHVALSAYGSVQEQGLRKMACYALVLRDDADAMLEMCELRDCSEAAVLVAHRARARLHACRISACESAFMAGTGRGRVLELSACEVGSSARRLWADADRPRAFVWGGDCVNGVRDGDADDYDSDADAYVHGIVPPQQPRGYEDSDSDDSLDEATFAGMELRMEELDDEAVSQAQR